MKYWNRFHRLQKTIILLVFFLVVTFFFTRSQIQSLDASERARADGNVLRREPADEEPPPEVKKDRALLLEKVRRRDRVSRFATVNGSSD